MSGAGAATVVGGVDGRVLGLGAGAAGFGVELHAVRQQAETAATRSRFMGLYMEGVGLRNSERNATESASSMRRLGGCQGCGKLLAP